MRGTFGCERRAVGAERYAAQAYRAVKEVKTGVPDLHAADAAGQGGRFALDGAADFYPDPDFGSCQQEHKQQHTSRHKCDRTLPPPLRGSLSHSVKINV